LRPPPALYITRAAAALRKGSARQAFRCPAGVCCCYTRRMASTLLACPFCRELYEVIEAEVCPVCGVVLKGLGELPPSFEERERLAREWEQTTLEDRTLPWRHLGNGKGWLVLCCALGLALFFAPWIVLSRPETLTLSGFDLAHTRGFWFGGGAAAWLVNIPLVLSRRTLNQMMGVRIIATLLAGLTACQAVLLVLLAPTSTLIPLEYHWGWGFHLSAALSALAAAIASRFGSGPARALPARPKSQQKKPADPALH
jgi:hypothetical protein